MGVFKMQLISNLSCFLKKESEYQNCCYWERRGVLAHPDFGVWERKSFTIHSDLKTEWGLWLRKVWGQCLSAAVKLGSLEKTVIASLLHSGLHSGTIFYGKNDVICYSREWQVMPFLTKKDQKILRCQIDFLIIFNFFCSNHFLIRWQTKILL